MTLYQTIQSSWIIHTPSAALLTHKCIIIISCLFHTRYLHYSSCTRTGKANVGAYTADILAAAEPGWVGYQRKVTVKTRGKVAKFGYYNYKGNELVQYSLKWNMVTLVMYLKIYCEGNIGWNIYIYSTLYLHNDIFRYMTRSHDITKCYLMAVLCKLITRVVTATRAWLTKKQTKKNYSSEDI